MQTRLLPLLLPALLLTACPDEKKVTRAAAPSGVIQALKTTLSAMEPVAAETLLPSSGVLSRVYSARGHRPGWLDGACPSERAAGLLKALLAAGDFGLRPADYPLEPIQRLQAEARLEGCTGGKWPHARSAALELLLSDAFVLLASHLSMGRFDPEELAPRRYAEPGGVAEAALGRALESRRGVDELAYIGPRAAPYENLVATNRILRNAAAGGGYPTVPDGPELRRGDQGPRVSALRNRLHAAGYPVERHHRIYNRAVEVSVEVFQERAGLEETGVADQKTLALLNRSVDRHLDTIALNLERWRWLPRPLGEPAVLVNIPGQRAHLLSRGGKGMTMKAVVGRPSRPTPQLNSAINMVMVNPTWYVPDMIANKDILPKAYRNPGYLEAHGFRWVDTGRNSGWGAEGASRLIQLPGRHNALGRLKLVFPNKHDVYLHDTSARHLFARQDRFFSSGCVRLERADALTAEIIRRANGWSGQKVEAALAGGGQRRIPLERSINVHLIYMTAWAQRPGHLRVYEDVYELNDELAAAMAR